MANLIRKTVIGAVAIIATAVTVTPAFADPGFVPARTDIVGVGSDTTQDYMNAVVRAYNNKTPRPVHKLASFNATPKGSRITPKAGCARIERPDGSSAGVKALVNDTSGCIDFARSSSGKKSDGSENALAYFAFGRDSVTWATQARTNAPRSLNKLKLSRIYRCSPSARRWKQVGGRTNKTIKPFLPQEGSGTRKFFLKAIGLEDSQVGSCVNQRIQENNGRALPKHPNAMVPYSTASFIAQRYRKHNNRSGTAALHRINGISPTLGTKPKDVRINQRFPADYLRLVYNVVKKEQNGTVKPKYKGLFAPGGFLCNRAGIVRDYGFLPLGRGCGAQS